VKLQDGETLEAELVIAAIGVVPETKLAERARLPTPKASSPMLGSGSMTVDLRRGCRLPRSKEDCPACSQEGRL